MIVTVTVIVNKNNNNDRIGSTENPGKKEGRKGRWGAEMSVWVLGLKRWSR